ncbi:unnamed protein product [Schistocephalus solidus]|uniref:CN hydrolase domain-containing protein n=1 Tax=Schistocephalus solidus TaxID=70667 RepID=A0A183THB3_SCHSO|nr:unnamed protein product [Schistocephalus solidus]
MLAIVQLASTNNKEENLKILTRLVESATEKGAEMVFLPEAADFIAGSQKETFELTETIDGKFLTSVKNLAERLGVWISVGFHRKPKAADKDKRLFNTHAVIDNTGEIRSLYDKTHLFSLDLNREMQKGQVANHQSALDESSYIRPGSLAPVVVHNTPVGNVGLAICYDLRFPELATSLRYQGDANVLAYPSAFTLLTGQAGHWHTLLRARAIETQSYVVAAAQDAVHSPKFSTYGHSLVVDPWGQIIAECKQSGPGIVMARINHDREDAGIPRDLDLPATNFTSYVRRILPVSTSRRFDLYPQVGAGQPIPIGTEDFRFGMIKLSSSQIFYRTAVSMAFVNISPLVPGHVLVTPIAVVERFNSLPDGTICDMYMTVKRVSEKLLEHFQADSLTISIQDGKNAGQSVPLAAHDKVANRKYRSPEEMAAESLVFRKFFYDDHGQPLH